MILNTLLQIEALSDDIYKNGHPKAIKFLIIKKIMTILVTALFKYGLNSSGLFCTACEEK